MSRHLSVIIPAYNEENKIKETLGIIYNYLSRQNYSWEAIVVSDGGTDRTVEIVSEFISNKPEFNLIANTRNHGKGFVVRQGMLQAQGDFRLFTDADNSTSIEQIEKFWPYFSESYAIVIGSIEVEGAVISEHAQWYRRLLGHYSKYLIRVVAGLWDIRDTQRGFKCFTAKAAEDIFSRAIIDRWGFDIEVLALAKKMKYKIKEVPMIWNNPSESKVRLSSYFSTLGDLLKIRWRLLTNKYKL
ncbi:MAG: Glycosyl transferase, family 2 [Candidatus Azambacteria bacterium GW2011_GWE1_42_9]|nr:MAG: Glycosyl transferase, family 2 [Candidatus Azambacteria bacterium GW2011_GWF1_41_10]KKS49534.1 MAG: Glycosyl transferase, family 2 [Candidatus Azambacteria bacterium GW2011_GWF2_42_22]KKS69573.1 MAG: Glycosyl transferase, family 2 [Candidatus Azambacteria bacterium GW2011_GWA2_42_62]KKS74029.1 MAG: Glycosyl transferase, family 2 [Candidatus Azambacteria bacterium GW2011_GWB1_42_72]KKS79503.1 MAG: Glycosyl transferase, family 2 [Candidatus Azambacteria bacterium GW2011_GWE1_42_9]KKT0364